MVRAAVAEAAFTLKPAAWAIDTLSNFQFVAFDAYRDGTLNTGDGHNKVLAVIVVENAYETIENTAANAHPLAAMQESTHRARRFHSQKTLQGFYFMVRNGGGLVAESGKPEDTADFQNGQTLFTSAPQAHKHITLKERRLYCFAPVTPAVHGFQQGKKGFGSALAEQRFHLFFELRSRPNRVPMDVVHAADS
jgi:hypothetical protein